MDKTTTAATRLSFSATVPNHQIAWDSTSLGALKRCPRYYQYNILEGHVTKAENVHLRFGSEYNNALVTYNKARVAGAAHTDATLAALRYALTSTWDSALGRPWTSDLPAKTRETLIRSLVWYLDTFADDPCKTVRLRSGDAAVELSFRLELGETSALSGDAYLLCGYLDRLVEWEGTQWITDWKTTKDQLDEKYFAKYSPDNQVSAYSFAARIIGGEPIKGVIIDAVQLGVTFSRFQRAHITRTAAQLEEWHADTLRLIRQNETYVVEGHWPMNDAACGMYGGCPYRTICAASPELRPVHLKGLFHRRMWDPLVTREI